MTVELTEDEWMRLLNCAALAPYGQISVVFAKVQIQLTKQKAMLATPDGEEPK